MKSIYGGGAGSVASGNVVSPSEPAKLTEITAKPIDISELRKSRRFITSVPMNLNHVPFGDHPSPRDFCYAVERSIKLFYPKPLCFNTYGYVPTDRHDPFSTKRYATGAFYEVTIPLPLSVLSQLPKGNSNATLLTDLYDLYASVCDFYQWLIANFTTPRLYESHAIVNKPDPSYPMQPPVRIVELYNDDRTKIIAKIRLEGINKCYNMTTQTSCTPEEMVASRFKTVILSAAEGKEGGSLSSTAITSRLIKSNQFTFAADADWIDRELSRRVNTRPPHVIWERYLVKREKKTGSMRKFTAMTAGMYNVWPGSYLSYHRVSKGLFETAYF